jgi:phage tail tape-measure protein
MQKTSKHLDNTGKATKATGESKSGNLMDGIVAGLPKRVSPAIVDGIVRGIPRGSGGSAVSTVAASATKSDKGAFGAGSFPEGKM